MAECSKKCSSRRHGSQLTSSVTRRAVSDEALAAYLRASCGNFTQAFDKEGRTVLHMAASRGRKKLVKWLAMNSSEAFVNARDRESGYTPLHRSLFYGQIHVAVALMEMGVNTDIMDKDDYRALDHVLLDRRYMSKRKGKEPCDVYVWGSNSNYTLGTETQQQRKIPDELACFARNDRSIKQACLGKFHGVWVDDNGSVWACGQGGRFGAPQAGMVLRPKMLYLPEQDPCQLAAITLDSTVFLMESGVVLQYKMSECDSLISNVKSHNAIKLRAVKPITKLQEPLGLCASRNHTMVWNKRAIYTWGYNYGQLGHSQPSEKYIDIPKRVAVSVNNKEETNIELGAVSEGASVFNTSRGDVYLLHDHICKKIAVKQINLRQLCVESKVGDSGPKARVTVLLLTNLGQVILWHNNAAQLTRCTYGLGHQTLVTNIVLTHDAMYFTTKYGEAYQGLISWKSTQSSVAPQVKAKEKDKKSPLVKLLEKDDCTPVKIKRIPNIHRAVSITVDTEGLNFACLQVNPHSRTKFSPTVSPSTLAQQMDILRTDAHEDDLLHDVIFKVGTRLFPAHIFIVASGSESLYKKYQEHRSNNQHEKPIIVLDNVHPEVFERIIRYLYTGTCDVVEMGPCSLKIKKEDLISHSRNETVDEEFGDHVIESPMEISAFEVYKREGEKKKSGKNRNKNGNTVTARVQTAHEFCDPVKLVQASAKRLQVLGLHKLLDKFYYKDGSICIKESANLQPPTLSWSRDSFPELVDTTVRSKDGVAIPAHKCILAARLEYFSSMFMHSWTESEKQSTVTLPINHAILEPIIDFLYTDKCSELTNSESIDFLCNLLIVADQLFVSRLREMCELNLSLLVTLKNCTELCQFAHTYNSNQLKDYCMEFISLNLCTLLENKSLHILEDDLLEDLTNYYCKINTIMSSRIITPFYNAPDEEVIIECGKLHPVDLEHVDDDLKKVEVKKKKKTSKKIEYTESEKARMRYESVSSVNSLDVSLEKPGDITLALKKISRETEKSTEEKQEKWVKVTGQQKGIQARLKAISMAKEILNEKPVESFTRLMSARQNTPPLSVSPQSSPIPTTSRMSVSPKESPLSESPWKSPQSAVYISHVGAKLSQKQRKKLALQGVDLTPQNLDDYMVNKLSLTDSPPTPKNPWKVCEAPTESGSAVRSKPVQFNQILADQQKQKDNSSRIMTKSLVLTQLEDKAIEDLEKFYNAGGADEEWITVRRIELQVSSPQWIHSATK